MATKKAKTTTKKIRRVARKTAARGTARARIREGWERVVEAVAATEANLEAGVKKLLRRNKITTKDAATLLADVRALADRERKKAARELRAGFAVLQTRVKRERRGAAKGLDDAVRSALAALNIPSRSEVAALTRKVDELSKKIGRKKG